MTELQIVLLQCCMCQEKVALPNEAVEHEKSAHDDGLGGVPWVVVTETARLIGKEEE